MDLSAVRRDLVEIMFDTKHDDGSFAPLFIRLAWHLCGTYDAKTRTGGCNGCTMQFKAEQADPENAGLAKARELLEPLAERYKSSLSKADLFVLAAYVGLECADGPCVRFRTGRKDFSWQEAVAANGLSGCPFGDGSATNPTGSRLPAADRGKTTVGQAGSGWGEMEKSEAATIAGVRGVFHRLGFDDRETVALVLFGHQFGRMHAHLSGYEGAWYASSPAVWSSSGPGTTTRGYGFLDVFGTKWADYKEVQVGAQRQFELEYNGSRWVALPSDMVLFWDSCYRQHAQRFVADRKAFREEATSAWVKLTELGCAKLVAETTELGDDEETIRR